MRIALASLMLCFLPCSVFAQSAFNDEQRAEIRRIFQEEINAALDSWSAREKVADSAAIPTASSDIDGRTSTPVRATTRQAEMLETQLREAVQPNVALAKLDTEKRDQVLGLDSAVLTETTADRDITEARKFEIEAGKGAEKASFIWSWRNSVDLGGTDLAVIRNTGLRISAPISDKDKGFAEFATLDSLSSGLGFRLSKSWRVVNLSYLNSMHNNPALLALCTDARKVMPAAWGDGVEGAPGVVEIHCSTSLIEAARAYDPALGPRLEMIEDEMYGWTQEYSVAVEAARAGFAYVDPTTATRGTEHHVGWGLSASVGFQSPSRKMLLGLGAEYQRVHEGADSGIVCPPGSGLPVVCLQGPLGKPSEVVKKIVYGEVRGEAFDRVFSLRAMHDLDSGDNAVDMPIYLLRNSKGLLSAGLRFGWSEEDDFGASIFVSTPLEE